MHQKPKVKEYAQQIFFTIAKTVCLALSVAFKASLPCSSALMFLMEKLGQLQTSGRHLDIMGWHSELLLAFRGSIQILTFKT